jgi:hypothetical protein
MEPTPPVGWVAPEPAAPAGRSRIWLIAFLPLAFAVLVSIISPGLFAPMFDTAVANGGASMGIPLLLVAAALMLAGVVVMWRFPSLVGVLVAFVCFTFPSMFILLMGPAVCLIAQNLST